MNDRLLTIIEKYGLTQTEFANKIGVSKTLISLMIKGQRPVTESILDKIKNTFSEIDTQWLENGVGTIFKNETGMGNLFDNNYSENNEEIAEVDVEKTKSPINNKVHVKPKLSNKINVENASDNNSDISITPTIQKNDIERIVIFYSDGTFSEHLPRN